MNTRHGFLIGLALGLAVSVGFALGAYAPGRATAQTAAPRQAYEYQTIHHGWDDGTWAAQQAPHGWRFIGFDASNAHTLIFERPVR